ncbi:MAG: hypothetical protein ACLQVD_09875 [Capsulimonadaceae bacterium]
MTLTVELSPEQETRLFAAARIENTQPQALIQKWVDHLPRVTENQIDDDDPTIAYALARLAEAPTDPDEIREAQGDLHEFMRNMNRPRIDTGARVHYPEVE